MGAVRMRVQIADENIVIIDMTATVNILWRQKLHAYKKLIDYYVFFLL